MITDEMLTKAAREVREAMLASLPDPKECDHAFSPKFENKMKKLLRNAKHIVFYTVLRRVACILIGFFLLAGTFLAFNPDARAAIADWVQDKFGSFYHYFFVGESGSQPGVDETTGTQETPDTSEGAGSESGPSSGTHEVYYLSWVPEGYSLMTSFDANNGKTYIYVNGDSSLLANFSYMYGAESEGIFAGVGEYERKLITEGPFTAEFYLANDAKNSNSIVWRSSDGQVIFNITAFLGEKDLVRMALCLTSEKIN